MVSKKYILGKARYEAQTLAEAKWVARTWRKHALWFAPIHIRRNKVVHATITTLGDAFRYLRCAQEEQEAIKQLKNNNNNG